MLIFVILSTTEAYFPSQSLSHPRCNQHRSQALLCRLSTTILCPSSSPHYPPPKPKPPPIPLRPQPTPPSLSLHFTSRPPCHRAISYPATSSYSTLHTPSPPCPPPVSYPSTYSPLTHPSPSPPSISQPPYFDSSRSPESASYMNVRPESYQSNYEDYQLANEAYHTKNAKNVTILPYSSYPERSTISTKHNVYSLPVNVKDPKALPPSGQQRNYLSDDYSSNIIDENSPIPSQQYVITTTGKGRVSTEKASSIQEYETKYQMKTNCSPNNSNKCFTDDSTMPPENNCCTNCSIPCRFRYAQKILLKNDRLQELNPVCNNESLRRIIAEQVDDDIHKSKTRIEQRAKSLHGGLFEVICGKNFSYIIHTKDFCQYQKRSVTCYVFRSL